MKILLYYLHFLACLFLVTADGSCKANNNVVSMLEDAHAPLVAVTACTGEAGGRFLTALRQVYPAKSIRCLVRKGTTKPLDHLNDLESLHEVDFMDSKSISKAFKGAAAVYLNTPPSLDVLAMRENMAAACSANAATIQHVVFLGEAVDIAWYGLSQYWDDHKAGEDAVQKTGLPVTVLHPAFFTEGFGTHFGNPQSIVEADSFSRVGTAPVAYTSLADVGVVAAKILIEGPDIHGWKKYNLINEVVTGDQVAVALTKALGRTITYKPITVDEFAAGMVAGGVPEVFVEGYKVAVQHTADGRFSNGDLGQLEALLGRKPTSMVETFLELKPLLSKDSEVERVTNK